MTRDEAMAVLQANIATSREAVDVLRATRPMSIAESEAKRIGGGGPGVPTLGVGASHPAPAPSPTPCAECGTPLTEREAKRDDPKEWGKFTLLCGECSRLALGLL